MNWPQKIAAESIVGGNVKFALRISSAMHNAWNSGGTADFRFVLHLLQGVFLYDQAYRKLGF
ncbi:hypothetical protein FC47_GL000496 [Limosilactobacillus mucosae DSM 13345]|uniref:Uncharacterized protein n=1 Tax=Limosilactobacillus mucosae DSM 13345 TaxID=1423771 RepID=A0A0R1NYF8_LIMMU|nr:hypothetical protein FC47_GL000496 [Limosilactobacillus mucosae DSM 13345]